ncbi:hypothetical protein NSND_60086 [Nitrospira sp. ND1]|nr:hypothetical protein NSND_60086 [Nitrospira sp. ND1]
MLFTVLTPVTPRVSSATRIFCSVDVTTPFRVTTPRSVSTSIREKFDKRSEDSLDCTEAVMVASSMVCPAVLPVVDWQPTSESIVTAKTKRVRCAIIIGTPFQNFVQVYIRMRSDHVVRILRAPGGRLAHGFLGGLDGLIHEFPGSPSGVSQRLLSTLDIFLPAIHGVIPSGPTLFGSLVQFILGLGCIVAQGGAKLRAGLGRQK